MEHREYKSVNKPVRKKDAMQLLLGKPVYTEDLLPKNTLGAKSLTRLKVYAGAEHAHQAQQPIAID